MRQVTIYTTDNEYNHFVQLVKSLVYVKKIKTDENPDKQEEIDNLTAGLKEVNLFKRGELKTTSATDFLNELSN